MGVVVVPSSKPVGFEDRRPNCAGDHWSDLLPTSRFPLGTEKQNRSRPCDS